MAAVATPSLGAVEQPAPFERRRNGSVRFRDRPVGKDRLAAASSGTRWMPRTTARAGPGGNGRPPSRRPAVERPGAEQPLEQGRLAGAHEPEEPDDLPSHTTRSSGGRPGGATPRRTRRAAGRRGHEVGAWMPGAGSAMRGLGLRGGQASRWPERRAEHRRADLAGGGVPELAHEAAVAQHAHAAASPATSPSRCEM